MREDKTGDNIIVNMLDLDELMDYCPGYEPETFTPFDNLKVFVDRTISNREESKLGSSNMDICQVRDTTIILDISYIEAYGENGSKIINYLMNLASEVIIGATYDDTKGFWEKMGAVFADEYYSDPESFELHKIDFMNTIYYKKLTK